jgi:hypothetical protein
MVDCCGSFVTYIRNYDCFLVSRSVNNEIILFDSSFSTLLGSLKFDDFFRGVVVSKHLSIPLVFAFTNHSYYAFYLPSLAYLQQEPIRIIVVREIWSSLRNSIRNQL